MSLLRWMGVAPTSSTTNPNTSTSSGGAGKNQALDKAESSADAKRFGLENFGNTCYANSVLQALYFCEPFRELVTAQPDLSNLYPPAPPLLLPQLPAPGTATTKTNNSKPSSSTSTSTKPTASTSKPSSTSTSVKHPIKNDSKTGSGGLGGGHKRPVSGSGERGEDEGLNVGPVIGNNPPSLFSALRSLFVHISRHSNERGSVAPQAFIAKLKRDNELFRTTMHQDAHEFLNYLINRVVEDLEEEEKLGREAREQAKLAGNGAPDVEDLSTSVTTTASKADAARAKKKGTWVHELFEGTLTSETRCLTCETVSSRSEMFLDLSIDIEQNASITACLRQFSASEMLCQRNKFFCDSCCGLQEAEKRMKIKRTPEVLVVHLKRFKYQEEEGRYVKLNYRVAWPFELRLFNTVDGAGIEGRPLDRLYELWAVVVHIGGGPLHGHYITLIKAQGTWYVFDDNTVDTIRESDIPKYYGDSGSGTGYVLFYQAVDIDREALGLQPRPVPAAATNPATIPVAPPAANGHANPNGVPVGINGGLGYDTADGILLPNVIGGLKSPSGPPSPAVPISIEPASPPPDGMGPVSIPGTDGDLPLLGSVPPSPSVAFTHTTHTHSHAHTGAGGNKLEIPSRGHSPVNSPLLPNPPPIPASVPVASPGGGFFSSLGSLRHSKSVKGDRTSGSGHLKAVNGDAAVVANGHGEKEEKEKTGWLSFRSKEKRRDSVSQTQTQTHSQAGSQSVLHLHNPSVPSSPNPMPSTPLYPVTPITPNHPQVPPSPRASTTGRRPSTGATGYGVIDQLAPLPAAALPVPSRPPSQAQSQPLQTVILQSPSTSSGPPPALATSPANQSLHQPPTRRESTTDGPIDGSDSFSGSSSWTSGVLNGVPGLDVRDIPPVPKELPPVPPLPAPIPIPTPNHSLGHGAEPLVLSVGSGGQGTITQSPVPSTWSIPTDAREGEKLPVNVTATISSIAGSSSAGLSDLSIVTQSQPPVSMPTTTFTIQPSPSSTSQLSPPSATTSSSHPPTTRLAKMSMKDLKEQAKARKAAESVAKRVEEDRKRAEKHERERAEEERKRVEKEQHKLAKRTSRKMSLGLSGLWSHKDKEKDRDRGTGSFPGTSRTSVGVQGTN